MKTCSKCLTEKPSSDFFKQKTGKGGLKAWCKTCEQEYHRDRQRNIRLQAIAILGGKCQCGFSDIRALQIDHINGGGKQEAKALGGYQQIYKKIVNGDIDGYQILCANCNWIKRAEQNENSYYAVVILDSPSHGAIER